MHNSGEPSLRNNGVKLLSPSQPLPRKTLTDAKNRNFQCHYSTMTFDVMQILFFHWKKVAMAPFHVTQEAAVNVPYMQWCSVGGQRAQNSK